MAAVEAGGNRPRGKTLNDDNSTTRIHLANHHKNMSISDNKKKFKMNSLGKRNLLANHHFFQYLVKEAG